MANTTITQLSQSTSLTGDELFALDNGAGTFNTTLTSMSIYTDKYGSVYTLLSSSLELGDRIKVRRGTSLYNIQPGTSIFRDVPTSSNAISSQVVLGSDTRLSDARTPVLHSHSIDDTYLLQTELDKRIRNTLIAASNGVASLDGTGKIPLSQIPDSLSGQVSYIGEWNPVSNTPTLSDTTGVNQASLVKGNYYVVTSAGSVNFGSGIISFSIGDWAISNGIVWQKVNNAESIKSVSGKSGSAIILTVSDVTDAVSVSGSTMSADGILSITKVATSSYHVVNKAYVDNNFLPLAGGTVTGNIFVSSSNQIQFQASDRFASGTSDSVLFYKGANLNFGVYDNGNAFVRSDLRVGGDVIAFYTSDLRLKENVNVIDNPIDKINKIRGVSFDWKKDSGREGTEVGVIAQEIESVIPEAVTTRENGFKAVKYDSIIPLLIESIKALHIEIEQLKNSK